jgi:hypothetical protein
MSQIHLAATLASLSKHKLTGGVGIIAGVVVVGFGALRFMMKAAGAMLLAFIGLVVLVVGALLYGHVI